MKRPRNRASLLLVCSLLIGGCASYATPQPEPLAFQSRIKTLVDGQVRVSAAVLDPDESDRAFAAPLAANGIQPVWIEVDNHEAQELALMLLSVDPDYFSPSEAAWKSRRFGERKTPAKMRFFLEQQIPLVIPPHTKRAGYVYTNLDPGVKAFAVELIGEQEVRRFQFVQKVPGFEADFMRVDFKMLYEPSEIQNLDLSGLRRYLESLPCCVFGGDQKTLGDPLNLAIVGQGNQMLATLVRRGWDLTETVRVGTAWRTALSSLFKSEYRTSPVSSLYLFGRPQDVALQKARSTVDERNHLRLWLAPVTLEGEPVWVGQISRDIGVRLSSKTLVTHKIDPVVDEARTYVLLDIAASQAMAQFGYTEGVGFAPIEKPHYNYTKDPYYTDGRRVVLILADDRVSLDQIERLDWAMLPESREARVPESAR
jgi:hypothetical protein